MHHSPVLSTGSKGRRRKNLSPNNYAFHDWMRPSFISFSIELREGRSNGENSEMSELLPGANSDLERDRFVIHDSLITHCYQSVTLVFIDLENLSFFLMQI